MHTSTGAATAPPARRAFYALLIGMLMAQLDTTIVVAALPSVTDDLASGGAVAGVTAAYLLTVTVSTPVHGRLGDLLGRRAVFRGALALFALGSVACVLAPTLPALTAARALQGLGGGGLVVTAISALAQLFGRQEMVRRQGYLTGVLAVSTLAGPPLGGLLAAGPGWRWIFLINLPLCGLATLPASNGDGGVLALGLAGGGMALTGAALGLSLQAYTLLAQGRARPDLIGATMGTLTFARQLGGSLGTAAFGWVVLAAPSERTGLTLALGVAAGCLVAALVVAPRRRDDPSGAGDDAERRG